MSVMAYPDVSGGLNVGACGSACDPASRNDYGRQRVLLRPISCICGPDHCFCWWPCPPGCIGVGWFCFCPPEPPPGPPPPGPPPGPPPPGPPPPGPPPPGPPPIICVTVCDPPPDPCGSQTCYVRCYEAEATPLSALAAPPVPGSGASYSQDVTVKLLLLPPPPKTLSGMWITCTETGVSLNSVCGAVTFYHNTSGTKHYTTPGGNGTRCDNLETNSYEPGSGQGDVPDPVEIDYPS